MFTHMLYNVGKWLRVCTAKQIVKSMVLPRLSNDAQQWRRMAVAHNGLNFRILFKTLSIQIHLTKGLEALYRYLILTAVLFHEPEMYIVKYPLEMDNFELGINLL